MDSSVDADIPAGAVISADVRNLTGDGSCKQEETGTTQAAEEDRIMAEAVRLLESVFASDHAERNGFSEKSDSFCCRKGFWNVKTCRKHLGTKKQGENCTFSDFTGQD